MAVKKIFVATPTSPTAREDRLKNLYTKSERLSVAE
jgi:hypothetical protein